MKSPTSCALIVFAFYLLSRLMGQIHGILGTTEGLGLIRLASKAMEVISMVLPRLDLFGQTRWILYGTEGQTTLMFLATQGAVFTFLIVCATVIDMKRRQF
jgi:hypothetical protein